ncbi:N-acetylmuramoyl-L-alanine amidase [Nocardioides sp. R1-1]|uniref:N-acetylmuramoyl-L-alanine amidase n=1 Tax=Nocardioides sp. R1-1 TaxID=3383502 RepID=UPI0038CF5876
MSPYPTEIPEHTRRSRFVTLCQQALALAVVVAVLTPAARTVTMEVRPAEPGAGAGAVTLQAATAPVTVPTEAVDPTVSEYALTASPKGVSGRVTLRGSVKELPEGGDEVTSEPLPVEGYGTVGVTWAHGAEVEEDAITVSVRTRTGDTWSDWTAAEYHDEHGPDPASAEAQRSRPGTEAVLVGDVDQVQVQVETTSTAPADLKVAVIDPGTPTATAQQSPSIDTAAAGEGEAPAQRATQETSDGAIALQAATTGPPQPQIYSRAQWGADERLRDASSLRYGSISAGFVHHTVNANDYQPSDVPGILRGIYAYHVKTRGWSDIGYNFLVDRFGRIWEGRAGGVDKPVVGAHTLGYNDYSFAMSAIGNFETAQPTPELLNAYGALFAWKLSLSGVSASSPSQRVGKGTFAAISGHRDAGKTACPGKYLYAQLPTIRAMAAQAQQGALLGQLNGNYIGSANPDIVVRSEKKGRLVLHDIDKVGGSWRIAATVKTNVYAPWAKQLLRVGDWDGDGINDLMAIRKSDKSAVLYRGAGGGMFQPAQVLPRTFGGVKMLAAVGDVTGDKLPDLMGQPKGGQMQVYPGAGAAGFQAPVAAAGSVPGKRLLPVGRWNKDGAPDALVSNGSALTLYTGILPGGWSGAKSMKSGASGYDWVIGLGPMASGGKVVIVRNKTTRAVYALEKVKAKKLGAPVLLKKRKKFDLAG